MINLQFEGRRAHGRTVEIAKIGSVVVGEVELHPTGRYHAFWVCYLDQDRTPRMAISVAQAKARLAQTVTEWVKKAGLFEGVAA